MATLLSNLYSNYLSTAILKTTVDAAGDLLVADGDNSITRLAVGSDGQFLTVSGTTPTWVDLPTDPALTTYTVTPVANVATIDMSIKRFNKLTITGNTTINPSNIPSAGISGVTVLDIYDGGDYTLTWNSNFEWASATKPDFSSNAWDRLMLVSIDGSKVWVHVIGLDFAS